MNITSIGIRNWLAGKHGEIVWVNGEGDQQMIGWEREDGQRAIETNGDPVFECEQGFEEVWLEKVGTANETAERQSAASLLGSLGGKARAAKLTPEQRTEAARRAGKARQAKLRAALAEWKAKQAEGKQ